MRDIAASLHAVDLSALLSRSATASWSLCTTCCVTVGRMKIWEATPSISTIGSSFRSSWSGGSNAWGITSNFSRSLRLDTLSGADFFRREGKRAHFECMSRANILPTFRSFSQTDYRFSPKPAPRVLRSADDPTPDAARERVRWWRSAQCSVYFWVGT
jgi:hypothetical protein